MIVYIIIIKNEWAFFIIIIFIWFFEIILNFLNIEFVLVIRFVYWHFKNPLQIFLKNNSRLIFQNNPPLFLNLFFLLFILLIFIFLILIFNIFTFANFKKLIMNFQYFLSSQITSLIFNILGGVVLIFIWVFRII